MYYNNKNEIHLNKVVIWQFSKILQSNINHWNSQLIFLEICNDKTFPGFVIQ